MSQPIGVLALRIWRNDQGEIRARILTKLDVVDATLAEISYQKSVVEIDAAVATWTRRFVSFSNASRITQQ